ncbi:hypothetical protein F5880DRAFT_1619322 [Lentinula raphanica]|nr:hypothetical protein F5880DRAFT_1619322 [Lentinula raphanica]
MSLSFFETHKVRPDANPVHSLTNVRRILVIDYFSDSLEAGDHIISQNLAQFEQLFYVELGGCSRRTFLLRALLAHPTVTSILVGELPDKSMCNNDLSKVICNDQTADCAFSDSYQNYFNQGMRLHRLELLPLRTLDDLLRSKLFPGLREIRMVMGVKPFSSSLLSVVSAAHPTVNEFWLIDDRNLHFLQHTPPFISSFIDECQEQDLNRFFIIERVGLGKAIGQSPYEWYVIGLTLKTTFASKSRLKILNLVSSLFPKLETLTLNLEDHNATYHINDFATTLGQFVSLRTLFLYGVYKRLNFGSKKLAPSVRVRSMDTFDAMVARVETGTLWYTLRIAREVRVLDMIYIKDSGRERVHRRFKEWRLDGWLYVANGDRETGGKLQRVMSED